MSPDTGEADASLFLTDPVVRVNPYETVPLCALVSFETSKPVRAWLKISGPDGERETPHTDLQTSHALAALHLKCEQSYTIIPCVERDSIVQEGDPLTITTEPLPKSFPPLETVLAEPEAREPGVTIFPTNIWRDDKSVMEYGYLIGLDASGEVVWYYHSDHRTADVQQMKNGHLLVQHANYYRLFEIDVLGRVHRSWHASRLTDPPLDETSIPVDVDTMHHEILELPNGNFLTLSTEIQEFPNYLTSEFDADAPRGHAHVVCDVIVEFDPDTGEVIKSLHTADLLDRGRFGYMALTGFWKDKYNDRLNVVSRDWSHANAMIFVPEDNAVIVSFRHQDCLIKIDWTTDEIIWILGNPAGWGEEWQQKRLQPKGDLEWQYHQHGPQMTPHGTILLYDNGNFRAHPFEQFVPAFKNYSRVVEFKVNEEEMTVEQVWEFRGDGDDPFFCPFYCDVDWLPHTGNLLVTDGGHIEDEHGIVSGQVPSDHQWARIFEITRESPPRKVFEVTCKSRLKQFGWSIYRSRHVPSLDSLAY